MNFLKKIFNIRNKCANTIGILDGVDGPTAIYYTTKRKTTFNKEQELKQEQEFLNYAATKIEPNFKPFGQIEEYLVTRYNAQPCMLSDIEKNVIKSNIIMNKFPYLINMPVENFNKPTTKKEIKEYATSTNYFEEARKYPIENLGLIFKGYKLNIGSKDATVKLEMTTEYMVSSNLDEEIANDLFTWQGVSEEDIEKRTARFKAYAYTLKSIGKL